MRTFVNRVLPLVVVAMVGMVGAGCARRAPRSGASRSPATAPGAAGWVLVEFDVDEQGRVVDPRVVDSSLPASFDQLALETMGKWRYRPRIVDGKPVRVKGVRNKLTFTPEDVPPDAAAAPADAPASQPAADAAP